MCLYLNSIGRKVALVNLDPANDTLPYEAAINITELITLDDAMNSFKLGPNGGLMYCMEFIEKNIDWLLKEISKFKDHYFLLDFPGQVELYTHHNSAKNIMSQLVKFDLRLCSVQLIDSHHCSDPGKFISALLLSLTTMLHTELPHINILSKIDLAERYSSKLDFGLDFYTEVLNLEYLLERLDEQPGTRKFKKLNTALVGLIEGFNLVSFLPSLPINEQVDSTIFARSRWDWLDVTSVRCSIGRTLDGRAYFWKSSTSEESGRGSRLVKHFGVAWAERPPSAMLRQAILVPRIFSFLERSVLGSGERAGGLLAQETGKATCLLCGPQSSSIKRPLHTTVPRSKADDRKEMLASMPKKDEGTEGEKTIDVDLLSKRFEDIFPDENTPNRLFDGIPYSQLNICDIKATKNNTIISLNDHKGKALMLRSCGMEGFKNTRQGTNIAAQATGISLAMRAIAKGFKDPVRVRVSGIGPGRMSAIKGLSMGGMNVVSITDTTRVSFAPTARARKQRRL
ncbi:Hypothetical predicted protein [Cloeon dipterum]|uniref:GPN-loop GTPase 2 n=1 Tax=Cloeon dipterum TaxID=197152 RepID=A0A8S1CAS4_9INSE|nr:Hypothetical predicted protein [Cloeon dipterum]